MLLRAGVRRVLQNRLPGIRRNDRRSGGMVSADRGAGFGGRDGGYVQGIAGGIGEVEAERYSDQNFHPKPDAPGIPMSPVKQNPVGVHPSCVLWSHFHGANVFSCKIWSEYSAKF